ncbi:sensor histidine kinase [Azoarcus sp. L1K30]|uniref:sensor histidine kinase n=1 Tax=Azoarcus sp. L1K30 TaxID=2820277 RepID=UPI001B8158B8|nr:sensor histidine kinase [Azoarcus sp. L1K30]MBR0566583.1 sensor histidine kinase [Azoarcus sp. L1K30]
MESIKQKPDQPVLPALPDFRNLGVMLRVLVVVNLLAVLTVLVRVDDPGLIAPALVLMAGRVELPLFVSLLLLYALSPRLQSMRSLPATAAACGIVVVAVFGTWPFLLRSENGSLLRWLAWALGAAGVCLMYFDYRSRRYSPALTEARLLALTARIRPHFLFNTLNGVLGVIRSDPRRAERGLEELADLFRVFMRDNRELVPLGDEIALCERYLELEKLRLGERLQVRWEVGPAPADGGALCKALVPPLLLQPLLENAVYHGVEPALEAGEVVVRIGRRGGELWLEVENESHNPSAHRAGNHMAVDNIRERLMLFYDLEASLESDGSNGRYRVRVRLPFRKEA